MTRRPQSPQSQKLPNDWPLREKIMEYINEVHRLSNLVHDLREELYCGCGRKMLTACPACDGDYSD